MEDRIAEWLHKSGYPLELYVFSELKKRNYLCTKSSIYVDPETREYREIDVTAYHHGDYEHADYAYTRMLILECKRSDKPLLNLCTQNEKMSRFYHQAFYGDPEKFASPASMALMRFQQGAEDGLRDSITLFSEEVRVGYSLVPAFGSSDHNIYSGVMGLVKASTYHRRMYVESFQESRADLSLHIQDRNIFEFHLAALVVDAPLFDVFIQEDGSFGVAPSPWSILKVQLPWDINPHNPEHGYCIHVVTKASFPRFLDEVQNLADFIGRPEHVKHILDTSS